MPNYRDILLVEDETGEIELALYALRRCKVPHCLHVVYNGQEALDFVFCEGKYSYRKYQNPPQLILLDINLPLIDGLEVLRQIKANHRTQAIPIVMLTNSDATEDRLACSLRHANDYLQKPLDLRQFTQALDGILGYWL